MGNSFFSYSRADKDFALKLADDLRKDGISIWFDQIDIPKGTLWDVEIEKALKNCDTLIVVISTNSVKSNNVLDEISYAIEEGKKIIPVKISNCDIPFRIRRLQYIEFTKNYSNGLQTLISTLKNGPVKPPIKVKSNVNKYWIITLSIILLCSIIFGIRKMVFKKEETKPIKIDTLNLKDTIIIEKTKTPNTILNIESTIDSKKNIDFSKKVNNNNAQENGNTTATLVDANGNEIVTQKNHFDKKMAYYEGLAAVKKDGKWGFVNQKNEVVVPIVYKDVGFFQKGYSLVIKEDKFELINKNYTTEEIGDVANDENGIYWYQCTNNDFWYGCIGGGEILKTPQK